MATYFSSLAWKIPWTEEPGGLYSLWGGKESDMTGQLTLYTCTHKVHDTYSSQICAPLWTHGQCGHGGLTAFLFHVDSGDPMAGPHSVLHTLPVVNKAIPQALRTISVQSNWVLSPGLSTEAQVSALRYYTHQVVCISGSEMWQHGQNQMCWSHRDLSDSLAGMRFSTSFQWVFWENCSSLWMLFLMSFRSRWAPYPFLYYLDLSLKNVFLTSDFRKQ